MKIITNEKEIVRQALEEKIIHKKPSVTVSTLVKYYYGIGMDKIQIKKEIQHFLSQNYPYFNIVKWQKMIDNFVNKYANSESKLITVENIKITKNELNIISGVNNLKQEKILFVLLVYAKIHNQLNKNNNNWTNSEDKDIFSDAKLTVKIKDQRLTLHKLFQTGLISFAKKVNSTNICVNFIDEDSEEVIVLNDFRNFIYEYLKWKGEKIGYCSECGDRFRITSNRKEYCNTCWNKINKEQIKIRVKKYRNSKM